MRKQSHLIVRITTAQQNIVDLVELSASDQVIQSSNKIGETIKKFVTNSFNSLSIALNKGCSLKEEEHSTLTQILSPTLSGKIILCCVVSPLTSTLRHSFTALKFVSKIRDSVLKKKKPMLKASPIKITSPKQSIDLKAIMDASFNPK